MIAALSIYQSVIAYVLPLYLMALMVRIIGQEGAWAISAFWHWPEIRAIAVVVVSVVLYLVLAHLISHASGIPLDGRTNITGLIDMKAKLKIGWTALGLAFWPTPGLIPFFTSSLLIALLALCAAIGLAPLLRRRRILAAVICLGLLIAGVGFAAGASVLGKIEIVWLVPRTLAGISAFAAGLVVVGWHFSGRAWRSVVVLASGLLALSYVGASNRILSDQHRLNRWDAQQANRIIERLERLPAFTTISALAIIGGSWRRGAALDTTLGDMNISALAVSWAKLGLIQEATGYRFEEPTASDSLAAEQYCREVSAWPAENSVTIQGRLGIVCLTRPG